MKLSCFFEIITKDYKFIMNRLMNLSKLIITKLIFKELSLYYLSIRLMLKMN